MTCPRGALHWTLKGYPRRRQWVPSFTDIAAASSLTSCVAGCVSTSASFREGHDRRGQRCLTERCELVTAFAEHRLVHDRVPSIERLCPHAHHRHRSGPRHVSAFEIADGRSPEVVRNPAREGDPPSPRVTTRKRPARLQAASHARRNDLIGLPSRWNSHGTICPRPTRCATTKGSTSG